MRANVGGFTPDRDRYSGPFGSAESGQLQTVLQTAPRTERWLHQNGLSAAIFANRRRSLLIIAPNSSGPAMSRSAPSSATRLTRAGSDGSLRIALTNLSMIAGGVREGAKYPNHGEYVISRRLSSAMVGSF